MVRRKSVVSCFSDNPTTHRPFSKIVDQLVELHVWNMDFFQFNGILAKENEVGLILTP